jgi:hypothetical protein
MEYLENPLGLEYGEFVCVLLGSVCVYTYEELDGPAVSALRRAIAEVKQRWSVIGWVSKNLLTRAPPCCGRHVKPLVPAAFAIVSTYQSARQPRGGLWPVLFMCNP